MKNLRKKGRRRFDLLSPKEVHALYRYLGGPPKEAKILIDAYHDHLSDQDLMDKHLCSRSTVARAKRTFWRRVEACTYLVPGLVTPEVRNILVKILILWTTVMYCSSLITHNLAVKIITNQTLIF